MPDIISKLSAIRSTYGVLPSCLFLGKVPRPVLTMAIEKAIENLGFRLEEVMGIDLAGIDGGKADLMSSRAAEHDGPLLLENVDLASDYALERFLTGSTLGPSCRLIMATAMRLELTEKWTTVLQRMNFVPISLI